LPDLAQVNLNSGIAILSSHITLFHQTFWGIRVDNFPQVALAEPRRARVLASWEVFNNVKYSE
jgi:hypothetical protein